jgi:hypothetical protein
MTTSDRENLRNDLRKLQAKALALVPQSVDISTIKLWFERAVPKPTDKNISTQLGCHFEEIAEMLDSLVPGSPINAEIHAAADEMKRGPQTQEQIEYFRGVIGRVDRTELLDSLCDQIVTAIGVAHMFGLDINGALSEVNASNWSKFDENGRPIFNEQGKIAKGPNYRKPDLSRFV